MSRSNARGFLLGVAALGWLAAGARASETLEAVVAGAGKAKLNSLLQFWTLNDTTATSAAKLNFRVRRAELKLSGSLAEGSRWFVMADPAKALRAGAISASNDNKILQDIGVAFSLTPELELIGGQFKIPTTTEGLQPSAELLFPERAFVARNFGDRREPGLQLAFRREGWSVAAMVSDGQAANVDDVTNPKDLSIRGEVSVTNEVKAAAFATAGDFGFFAKGRWGANVQTALDSLHLRCEGALATDAGVRSRGAVGEVAYHLSDAWRPAARYELLDSGTFTAKAATFGVSYLFAKHGAKIQTAYVILDGMGGSNGSYSPSAGVMGSLLTVAFQSSI